MIGDIGAPELLIILAIVILVFGVGRVGALGRDLGTSVREFRRAVKEEDEAPPAATTGQPLLAPPTQAATTDAASTTSTVSAPRDTPRIF